MPNAHSGPRRTPIPEQAERGTDEQYRLTTLDRRPTPATPKQEGGVVGREAVHADAERGVEAVLGAGRVPEGDRTQLERVAGDGEWVRRSGQGREAGVAAAHRAQRRRGAEQAAVPGRAPAAVRSPGAGLGASAPRPEEEARHEAVDRKST